MCGVQILLRLEFSDVSRCACLCMCVPVTHVCAETDICDVCVCVFVCVKRQVYVMHAYACRDRQVCV